MSEQKRDDGEEWRDVAHRLAMRVLQSDLYVSDIDAREATDDILAMLRARKDRT